MGKRLRRPITKKKNDGGESNGFRYAVASMQGWRKTMEDAHCVALTLPGQLNAWAFAGVFDGHGGKTVSKYTSKKLLPKIIRHITDRTADVQNASDLERQQSIKLGIVKSFLKVDDNIQKKIDDNSGTTASCVLIARNNFYFANCGDSRAIICRDGKIRFKTTDHKPKIKAEQRRILAAGGHVRRNRVDGRLAVSRALGDFDYKDNKEKGQCDQKVSPVPDVTNVERDNETDHFIVLACDGVFDVMSNYELITFIKSQMAKTKDLKVICNNVADHCLKKGSRDNISVVLMVLPGCPKHEDMAKKRKLNFLNMKDAIRCKKLRISRNDAVNTLSSSSSSEASHHSADSAESSTLQKTPTQSKSCVGRDNKEKCVPNAFMLYFMDYWKENGGNICKTAKTCGEKWTNLVQPEKEKYRRRYLYLKRTNKLKRMK